MSTLAVGVAMVLAIVVSSTSWVVWRAYYTHQPLWVEHAAYGLWSNVHFADVLAREGTRRAIVTSLADGERHLLQPVGLGLVWPSLLSSPDAHILVSGGALFLFLALLAIFIRERTGSRGIAVGGAVLLCTFHGLYDERSGIGVPWPDYQSMFFLSSAVMSLALYALSARVAWLATAGACVSLAALARDTGAVYAVIVCVPIVALLAVQEFRRERRLHSVLQLGLWCGIPAVPAMVLLASKLAFFGQYYMTSNVSQLRQPLAVAAGNIWHLLLAFVGIAPLVTVALLVAGALLLPPKRAWATADVIVIWAPVSFLLFLLANGYTSDVTKEIMYVAPGLAAAAATLRGGIDLRRRWVPAALAVALGVCVLGAGNSAAAAYRRATSPDAEAISLRASQRALAQALAAIRPRVQWQSFSRYDWGTVVSALTYYEFGHFQPTDNRLFHNRKNYWDARFPNLDLPRLQAQVLAESEQDLDVAIVLQDPDNKPVGMEDYSFSIASYAARQIRSSSEWQHATDVETSASGPLSLYFNLRRMGDRRPSE